MFPNNSQPALKFISSKPPFVLINLLFVVYNVFPCHAIFMCLRKQFNETTKMACPFPLDTYLIAVYENHAMKIAMKD